MNNATPQMTAAEYRQRHGSGASERVEQKALVKWAAAAEAERPALRLLFHVPNGGHRPKRTAARMKRLGTKAGVPDLCLPVPRCAPERAAVARYGALWIEMKAPSGGRLRKAQRWWKENLRKVGHAHGVCHGWEEARCVLCEYLDGTFTNR